MRADHSFRELLTDRLRLRRSVPEDAPAITAYRTEPMVHRWQGWERTDVEGVRAEIEEMAARAPGEDGGWVQLSVEERDTGRLVGDVGMSPAEGEPGVMKVGYTMSPDSQGKGYATEAVRALVAYAFDRLGADVVRAFAHGDNVASHRVAEKAGLTLVERIERHRDGATFQVVRYELARS
jgi:RimJ/RimL family protein N-acetyltransferase